MKNPTGPQEGAGVSADAVDQDSRAFAARVDQLMKEKKADRHDAAYQARVEDRARLEAMIKAASTPTHTPTTPQQNTAAQAPQPVRAVTPQRSAATPRYTEGGMASVQTQAVQDIQDKHRKVAPQDEQQKTGQAATTTPARRSDAEVSDKEHARQSRRPGSNQEIGRYRELMQMSNQQASRGSSGHGRSR